jgi:hypothetical protein
MLALNSLGHSRQTIKGLLDGERNDIASHRARLSRNASNSLAPLTR